IPHLILLPSIFFYVKHMIDFTFMLFQKPAVPAKKLSVPVSKNGAVTKKAKPASSSESDSDEEDVSWQF
ncbi:hypothetical protein PJP10_32825, partial [Mycobacterium kansasii]